MARLKAVERLLNSFRGLDRVPFDLRASLQVFPDLNVDRVASDLRLAERGAEKGKRNEPPTTSQMPDDVEAAVIERIEAERRTAHGVLLDELRTYAERLSGLDFEGRFGLIRQASPAAISEFRAEVAKGRDELHGLRRDLREQEDERTAFRRKHRLDRTARVASGGTFMLKAGLLAVLFLVEIVLNGYFLAKGSDLGLLGGVAEAVTFALLNVGVSALIAIAGVRQLARRGLGWKMIGGLSLAAYVAFAILLNLALAHYREVSGTFADAAGLQVVARLLADPLALADVKSWLFAALGLLFSAVAFGDALLMADPHPGYGGLERRYRAAHQAYIDRKADLIGELQSILDGTAEDLNEVRRDLGVRRGEHDQILEARMRVVRLFEAHQAHLERALAALLSVYREANTEARDTKAPRRFGTAPKLERIPAEADLPEGTARDDLRRSIAAAQDLLAAQITQITQIHDEFEQAVATYRQIDDIVQEPANAAPFAQAA